MFKLKKIKFYKSKNLFKKFLTILAEHSFLTFLVLFIISLGIGASIFFQCNVLINSTASKAGEEKSFKLEIKAYQYIKDEWVRKKEAFSQAEEKKYPNPFSH